MRRRFQQVDVFSAVPYGGNPVAVVLDGDGLSSAQMQRFAAWTNLSETTFVLPPASGAADYGVRIFTPAGELPFAGHPTLGTCHAWLSAGGTPRGEHVVQECAAGLVPLRRDGARLAFGAPPLVRSGPVDGALLGRIAAILRIAPEDVADAAWVDNGPGWVAVLLADADAVLAVAPGFVEGLDIGVVGLYPPGSPEAIEVRAFFGVGHTTVEDPVTGSLNASLAEWLVRTGRLQLPYTARQGTALGRYGQVHLTAAQGADDGDDSHGSDGSDGGSDRIWVGGSTVTWIDGHVEL